jgi:hypothetical protein
MTLNQNINSNTIQQFQRLWERMLWINTHIALVNKEIEIVKSRIQELIRINISNLVTIEDLSNLEDKNELPDLSDYATKEYVDSNEPDLSNWCCS